MISLVSSRWELFLQIMEQHQSVNHCFILLFFFFVMQQISHINPLAAKGLVNFLSPRLPLFTSTKDVFSIRERRIVSCCKAGSIAQKYLFSSSYLSSKRNGPELITGPPGTMRTVLTPVSETQETWAIASSCHLRYMNTEGHQRYPRSCSGAEVFFLLPLLACCGTCECSCLIFSEILPFLSSLT